MADDQYPKSAQEAIARGYTLYTGPLTGTHTFSVVDCGSAPESPLASPTKCYEEILPNGKLRMGSA